MGRARRAFTPDTAYHIFVRGSNRQRIFSFDSDRIDFLECLGRALDRERLHCLAYCLLSNHYHLVVETGGGDLSRAMKALNGRYALRFNRRHERDAHLFKNRFGAVRQETEAQLLWALRYVVTNPVDSGLCSRPEDWQWSSYRAAAGLEPAPAFLDVRRLLSYFGDTPDRATRTYRWFVAGFAGV